mmetsp:Transcript_7734/g.17082  ORF Transcript_7734/g.17082 Transcript_7734/m.17082 type:complete len:266 (-) Transcript_7734:384-1181(-)
MSDARMERPRQQNERDDARPRTNCLVERRNDHCTEPVTLGSERSTARPPTWARRPSNSVSRLRSCSPSEPMKRPSMAALAFWCSVHHRSTQLSSACSGVRALPSLSRVSSSAIRLCDVICSVTSRSWPRPCTRASRSGSSDSARSFESIVTNSSKSSSPSELVSAALKRAESVLLNLLSETAANVRISLGAASWNSRYCSRPSPLTSIRSKTCLARCLASPLTCSSRRRICCCCVSTRWCNRMASVCSWLWLRSVSSISCSFCSS